MARKAKVSASAKGGRKAKAKGKPKLKRAVRSPGAPTPRSDDGPVTLEEAKVLAAARQPRRALRGTVVAKPSPESAPEEKERLETIGDEREKLEEVRKDERERRLRDYKATMTVMKERGAKRPGPAVPGRRRRRAPGAPVESFRPLQVFAEGDSWFDYPIPFFGGGIIPRLEKRLGVPILNLAEAGDEVRFMLGVKQRERLVKCLTDGCPAGGPWDALLFSGGGNDIVDNPMALWIRDFVSGSGPAAQINQPRYDTAMALVRAGYEDLIDLRDKISPDTHIIFHGYDFAIPDGRGICGLGPWLKPTFDLRKFPTRADGTAVVKEMLQQFEALLTALTTKPNVTYIKTQGTLPPQPRSWHNELHPQSVGFDKFAGKFHQELKRLFPNRVV